MTIACEGQSLLKPVTSSDLLLLVFSIFLCFHHVFVNMMHPVCLLGLLILDVVLSACVTVVQVTGLAVSDRHPYMFSAGLDKMVKCWDMEYNKVSCMAHFLNIRPFAKHLFLREAILARCQLVWTTRSSAGIWSTTRFAAHCGVSALSCARHSGERSLRTMLAAVF